MQGYFTILVTMGVTIANSDGHDEGGDDNEPD
jgi:hypothetical protein